MNATTPRNAVPPRANTHRPPAIASIPFWVRVGLPAALAMLAFILNAIVIIRQLNPIQAYAVTANVTPGMLLAPEHLQLVKVGGNLDRTKLLTESDLIVMLEIKNASTESLQKSLAKTPLVYSRRIDSGELLTQSSLGGLERAAAGQRRIEVPIANIVGDCAYLLPGQPVFFNVLKSGSNLDPNDITEIGPYRVAFGARKRLEQGRDHFLPLICPAGQAGELTPDLKLLTAAHSNRGVRLVIVDKPISDASAQGRSGTVSE